MNIFYNVIYELVYTQKTKKHLRCNKGLDYDVNLSDYIKRDE